jgi:raffinose/stachyose/melibiose transport system permease protein
MILSIALIVFGFPFLLVLLNSFKTNSQIVESIISLPTSLHFTNFAIAMDKMNYWGSLWNTIVITLLSVSLISLLTSMTAHYFVRNNTKLNNMFFFMMVSSMIIPFQAIMIPLVSVYGQKLGWIQSQPQLTLIFMYLGFGSSLSVFIYHGFVKGIPLELEEATLIDGCNRRQTFFKIVLPILTPTTVTIGILNTLWIWNDYLLPVLILQNAGQDKLTLLLAVKVFSDTYSTNYEQFLPAVLMIVLPLFIVYFFAQRYIIQGVTQGAIK